MQYKINVTKSFSAAHALREYKGKCENLHGHNWKVRACVLGKKLKNGILIDFKDVKHTLNEILNELDHNDLNTTSVFKQINPTAENIASYIFDKLSNKIPKGLKVFEIEVWESENSSAIVNK
ncbi:6-carboxytetrahydropterin synthase QueD [Elusimicrobiota bacterium]